MPIIIKLDDVHKTSLCFLWYILDDPVSCDINIYKVCGRQQPVH